MELMPTRRYVTGGLLASAASLLTGCGGALTSGGGESGGGVETRSKWKSPFGDSYKAASPLRRKRSSPASLTELIQPGPLKEMTLGAPDAKATVIEYFSLTCPVCHRFHQNVWPQFRRQYIDSGKIRFIAREFPIGRSSGNAAIALRCVDESKYFDLMNRFLAEQKRWVSQEVRLGAIHSVAAPFGLTRAKFDSCLANQEIIEGIRQVKQRGRFLGVIGTPTFFVNERQLRGNVTLAQLSAAIDPLLS
jgi:protein-disulfide isomerase